MINKPTPPKQKKISSSTYFRAIILFLAACYGLYYFWTNSQAVVLFEKYLSNYEKKVASYNLGSQSYRSETMNFIRSVDKDYPIDDYGNMDVTVTTLHKIIESKGSVGNDYYYSYSINDNSIRNNPYVSINLFKPLKIFTKFVESDPSISDIGTAEDNVRFQFASLLEGLEINQEILVRESGGTRYAGSYDLFRTTYTIKPRKQLKYTFDFVSTVLETPILYMGFGLFLVITLFILWIINKNIRITNQKNNDQYKKALEQYETERRDFLYTIKGKSIRKLAGVPINVSFTKDGLPFDSENQSKYGSFTLYITPTGYCYHTDRTCPKSRNVIPINLVKISSYAPCSRCAKGHNKIPNWYTAYLEYNKKIKHYEISNYIE